MKKGIEKRVASVLACLILVLPGALSARERKGANILIALKDGQTVSGELIAVKPDSLLLLNPAGKDESIGLVDIATIRIIKKRRPTRGVLYGTLIGGAAGGLVGYVLAPKGMDEYPDLIAVGSGFFAAVLGGFIGLVSQSGADLGKEVIIAGKPQAEVKASMAKLSRFARLRSQQ